MSHPVRAIFDFIATSTRESFGHPVTFERWLKAFPDARVGRSPGRQTIAEQSVVRWDQLGRFSLLRWPHRYLGSLPGWRVIRGLGYTSDTIQCPALAKLEARLVSDDEGLRCDILDIEGMASSKSELQDYTTIGDMAVHTCPSYIEFTREALERNLAHNEIRILRPIGNQGGDHFSSYGWDGRIFLSNHGGSHHFAAAHHIAKTLGEAIPLHGKLYHTELDVSAARSINDDFAVYAISDRPEVSNGFQDAMSAFCASYYWCEMPAQYGDARAIFLPRSCKRAMRIAERLCSHGFFEVGAHVRRLAENQVKPTNVNLVDIRSTFTAH